MILFDLPVYQFILQLFVPSITMTTIMKLITTLASPLVIITGILCVAILVKDKKYFKIFFVANLVGLIINNIIKFIVHRPRPTTTMLLTSESSYSFPSSHAMMSVVFYGLIIYYAFKFIKNRFICNTLVAFIITLIFFIGISRIYLGVHYPTDVLFGFIFGIIYLTLFIKFITPKKAKSNIKSKNTK